MRKQVVLFFMVLWALFSLGAGEARGEGSENKRLGVGIHLGEPLGFAGRFYFFDQLSLDLQVGYGFGEEGIIIQPSALFHLRHILDVDGPDWSLVPHFGAGFKTGVDVAGARDGQGIAVLRFPLGVTWVMKEGVFEVSAEFAPGVEFSPETEFDPTGGIGLRYYFF